MTKVKEVHKAIPIAEVIADKKSSKPGERLKAYRVNKPKGAKAGKTKAIEKIGANGWEQLIAFVSNEGAQKYIQEVQKLQDESYIRGFSALLEYVKPKLVRSEA